MLVPLAGRGGLGSSCAQGRSGWRVWIFEAGRPPSNTYEFNIYGLLQILTCIKLIDLISNPKLLIIHNQSDVLRLNTNIFSYPLPPGQVRTGMTFSSIHWLFSVLFSVLFSSFFAESTLIPSLQPRK